MSVFEKTVSSPTRGYQNMLKKRLELAIRMTKILELKLDHLAFRYRDILTRLSENRSQVAIAIKDTHLSLSEVKFVTGNINQFVLENVNTACIKVVHNTENIAGMQLYTFDVLIEGSDNFEYIGLARGGQQAVILKQNCRRAVESLTDLATLQNNLIALKKAVDSTTRRVRALKYVVLPGLHKDLLSIDMEIEEQELEDFYRMKKLIEKKKFKLIHRSGQK